MLRIVPVSAKIKTMGRFAITIVCVLGVTGCQMTNHADFPKLRAIDITQYDQLRLAGVQHRQSLSHIQQNHDMVASGDNPISFDPKNRIATLYFETGISTLKTWEKQILARVVTWLKDNENSLLLVGHSSLYLEHNTHNVDITIGFKRAKSVYDQLVQQGVNPNRLNIVDKRHNAPRYSNVNRVGRLSNQRVEIFILK